MLPASPSSTLPSSSYSPIKKPQCYSSLTSHLDLVMFKATNNLTFKNKYHFLYQKPTQNSSKANLNLAKTTFNFSRPKIKVPKSDIQIDLTEKLPIFRYMIVKIMTMERVGIRHKGPQAHLGHEFQPYSVVHGSNSFV